MKYKKIMLLAICLVSLLAVSAVSAEENATEDIIADVASEDVVSVENNNVLNAAKSKTNLKITTIRYQQMYKYIKELTHYNYNKKK